MLSDYMEKEIDLEQITQLYKEGDHAIYWLGIDDETAFRCNVYLIRDAQNYLIVDPGSRSYFKQIYSRVSQITDPLNVTGLIICHQDPDVAASMIDWLEVNPDLTICSSTRTNVLLPHYGKSDYNFYNISENPTFVFESGRELQFIEAPFLHFPGAFTTYDPVSKFLFSGDIFAALDTSWKLIVKDFEAHRMNLDLFHVDYMASNVAARGFVRKLEGIAIEAILPQHGSIITKKDVDAALDYLNNLQCGIDLIYSDLV